MEELAQAEAVWRLGGWGEPERVLSVRYECWSADGRVLRLATLPPHGRTLEALLRACRWCVPCLSDARPLRVLALCADSMAVRCNLAVESDD